MPNFLGFVEDRVLDTFEFVAGLIDIGPVGKLTDDDIEWSD
jgi:hypothetical protein